nr:MAG TPA: hypothetical protein [Caudoviricetes sp.]
MLAQIFRKLLFLENALVDQIINQCQEFGLHGKPDHVEMVNPGASGGHLAGALEQEIFHHHHPLSGPGGPTPLYRPGGDLKRSRHGQEN